MSKWQIIIASQAQPFFEELLQAIKFQLIRAGNSVRIDNTFSQFYFDYIFVIAPHALIIPTRSKINCRKLIMLQTEQLPQEIENQYTKNNWFNLKEKIKQFDYIFDLYEGNLLFLNQQKILNCFLFKLGHDPAFLFSTKKTPEIYDFCFFGYLSDRRKKLIDQLAKKFKMCPIHLAFNSLREQSYQQSKICLNVHVEASDFFERLRIEPLIINNKFVLSENATYFDPLIPDSHLVFRSYEQLETSLAYYLKNIEERKYIAQIGANFFREKYLFSNNFQTFLQTVTIE